jgi:hypothetical protein
LQTQAETEPELRYSEPLPTAFLAIFILRLCLSVADGEP